MTPEDARKLATIVSTADHGCSVCIRDLCERLNDNFPGFRWEMTDKTWSELDGFCDYPVVDVRPTDKD